MKVFLGVGHGGKDAGAIGYLVEKDLNLAMAIACKDFLETHDVEVEMSRTIDEDNPLREVIKQCNDYSPDLALDIHNNAGGGTGFEAFYHYKGGVSKALAQNIEEQVLAIDQTSRGLKTKLNSSGNDYFGFIRQIEAPAVIAEGVFVDNEIDTEKANKPEEQIAFGEAYAKGILDTLGVSYDDKKVSVGSNQKVEKTEETIQKETVSSSKSKKELTSETPNSNTSNDDRAKVISPNKTKKQSNVDSNKVKIFIKALINSCKIVIKFIVRMKKWIRSFWLS